MLKETIKKIKTFVSDNLKTYLPYDKLVHAMAGLMVQDAFQNHIDSGIVLGAVAILAYGKERLDKWLGGESDKKDIIATVLGALYGFLTGGMSA